jgi:hypothetical protein
MLQKLAIKVVSRHRFLNSGVFFSFNEVKLCIDFRCEFPAGKKMTLASILYLMLARKSVFHGGNLCFKEVTIKVV